ncbi:cytochrome c oxidase accessory protein CcoG [Thalassotalea sp. 42_200_T64]|nr:cytochrome c oxidase accessory protein CcoG [Thalassotalea sp. 42_200_T64]
MAAFALFYVASKYGRIWCGFACPQMVWTLLFLWIENRIEGNRQQRIKLDKSKLSIEKLAEKLIKHSIWLTVSLITGLIFMSYFVAAEQIYIDFITLNTTSLITGWVLFFTLCTYVNASWIRDKMCQHMCPYARFQSVMFSDATSTVTYDNQRGESRGPRKLNQVKPQGLGDCVDCNLCVQVCPVGIDIRDGLQYDCINCGLCIDACDETMSKFSYGKELIRFASETEQHNDAKAKYGYIALLLICVGFMASWLHNRSEFEVSVLKDRNALYRVNELGEIENSYQLKILNKSDTKGHFKLSYQGLEGFRIESEKNLIVEPQQISNYTVTLFCRMKAKYINL